ncbi:hypothetical protein [Corallococcus exiguus]|uniref:hypothetical protein n=1 Tax=Corallococcus exiguus TaxID=83462 RepID=UPI0014940E39|nr:hypothetical protein [Corallococcus exiguus]NPD23150.1 hypothetical protein [Corallococcus exiguus]
MATGETETWDDVETSMQSSPSSASTPKGAPKDFRDVELDIDLGIRKPLTLRTYAPLSKTGVPFYVPAKKTYDYSYSFQDGQVAHIQIPRDYLGCLLLKHGNRVLARLDLRSHIPKPRSLEPLRIALHQGRYPRLLPKRPPAGEAEVGSTPSMVKAKDTDALRVDSAQMKSQLLEPIKPLKQPSLSAFGKPSLLQTKPLNTLRVDSKAALYPRIKPVKSTKPLSEWEPVAATKSSVLDKARVAPVRGKDAAGGMNYEEVHVFPLKTKLKEGAHDLTNWSNKKIDSLFAKICNVAAEDLTKKAADVAKWGYDNQEFRKHLRAKVYIKRWRNDAFVVVRGNPTISALLDATKQLRAHPTLVSLTGVKRALVNGVKDLKSPGNLLMIAFTGVVDVAAWMAEGDKPFTDLLVDLGMDVTKGALGALVSAGVLALLAFAGVTAPVWLVIGTVLVVGFFVGELLDAADEAWGISDSLKAWAYRWLGEPVEQARNELLRGFIDMENWGRRGFGFPLVR